MFEQLSNKFRGIFASLSGKRSLSEDNIASAVSEVRLALLDADVNYTVVKNFINNIKAKVVGQDVVKSVKPGEQFVEIVHQELVTLLGGGEARLDLSLSPSVIILSGLQGTGKTTAAVKLAHFLAKEGSKKRVLIAACDLARPAAVEQLAVLASQAHVDLFSLSNEKNPLRVAEAALSEARLKGYDVLIVDTAGRQHVDEELMGELVEMKKILKPVEILFVTSAHVGQDAATTAIAFNERLQVTGTIITMLDGSAKGGVAISMVALTGKPIKFEGVGEKIEDLQLFDARSMADRILGMGDTINLVKKAKEHFSEEEAARLEEKIKKASFCYDDYLKQIQTVRKMGSFKKIFSMMPLGDMLPDVQSSEEEFRTVESIILSMTPGERAGSDEITHNRAKRIARGAGVDLGEVNRLKKSFGQMKSFAKQAANHKLFDKMFQ